MALSVAVLATGILIGAGYLIVAHLFDPCSRGWWDFSTTVGDTELCSVQGEIAQRFHLLLHAFLGVMSASVAAIVYRRARLFGWWPPGKI
ncbi:hypothetical protein [Actinospongicola halichondriae]|uniref:hypothetical protein n=1 Tax=Actinospongicola halichondriae TaxID=3236844 RepID=UPI003D37D1F3